MYSTYPGIKLEPEYKIEHLSSYAHVVHTTAKRVISRCRKNENVCVQIFFLLKMQIYDLLITLGLGLFVWFFAFCSSFS